MLKEAAFSCSNHPDKIQLVQDTANALVIDGPYIEIRRTLTTGTNYTYGLSESLDTVFVREDSPSGQTTQTSFNQIKIGYKILQYSELVLSLEELAFPFVSLELK